MAPHFDEETVRFVTSVFERADALLLGRKTWEIFEGFWPHHDEGDGQRLFPERGHTHDLTLVESRSTPSGVTIQTYRPAGRATFGMPAEGQRRGVSPPEVLRRRRSMARALAPNADPARP
jgi:hypothetical protein